MRRPKGFTLIELLLVIAIIALLMAVLMPALQRVGKQAKAVACQSNLKQWSLYFSLYTDDNNGRFHRGWNSGAYFDDSRTVGLKELWTLKWNREFDTAGAWTRAGGTTAEDWPQWMRFFKDY